MAEWRSFLAELDWQKLTSTALFAGLVAILATVAIERFGGKLGGVLATLPTTIIPASLGFWYLSESDGDFIIAMWSVPIGMLLDAAFPSLLAVDSAQGDVKASHVVGLVASCPAHLAFGLCSRLPWSQHYRT